MIALLSCSPFHVPEKQNAPKTFIWLFITLLFCPRQILYMIAPLRSYILFYLTGIQQENRHIRQLQHENKELRAALEEHQNVLELIMSKYRQHMSCLINSTKLEKDMIKHENSKVSSTKKSIEHKFKIIDQN